jgi:hypothetical protein
MNHDPRECRQKWGRHQFRNTGRLQIGTVAGFRLELLADFVGIRTDFLVSNSKSDSFEKFILDRQAMRWPKAVSG